MHLLEPLPVMEPSREPVPSPGSGRVGSAGGTSSPARAGVVVGRRVGPAVRRNLVKRRLRELLRSRLPQLPPGTLVVVRALPGAADSDFARLGAALDAGLRAVGALPKGSSGGRSSRPAPGGGPR